MKRFVIILVALCSIFSVSAGSKEKSNVIMKAVKSSMEFTAIEVNNPIRVVVEERTDGNIIIRATESIMSHIQLSVNGNKLFVSSDIKKFNKKNISPIAEVYIPYNGKLNDFEATAASTIEVKPFINTKTLDIECIGASHITLKAKADDVSIEVTGAASINSEIECVKFEAEVAGAASATLKGSATRAHFEVAGASTLKAEDFICSQVKAEVVGASKAKVNGSMANVEAVGASNITVVCDTQLDATAVGASTVRYTGNCQVNIVDNIGASSIKKL